MLEARLGVHHPDLDRAEPRVGAHVVPEVGVVGDHLALLHELDPPAPVLEVVVARRDPDPGKGPEDRRAGREESGRVRAPEGRVGRQREQQRQVHAHPVGHVDRLVGVVESHVHVDAEDQLLAGHELQPGDQVAVAGPGHDPLVLPHRERVGAGRADRQPPRGRGGLHLAPQSQKLVARLLGVLTGVGGDLAHRLHQLGLDLALGLAVAEILEQALDRVHEIEGLGVHDHQLLLDPEGVARAREPVLHGATLSARTAGQTAVSCHPRQASRRQRPQ